MQQGKTLRQYLDEKPYIIAIVMALAVVLWMLSGSTQAESEKSQSLHEKVLPKVKVEQLKAQPIKQTIQLYGRSEPDKITKIAARESGEVMAILKQEGEFVSQGEVILTLDQGDLAQMLLAAQSQLTQRDVEYQGALKLKQRGLNDEVALARTKSALDSAKAEVARIELRIARTQVKAPFDGIINKRLVEKGDYVGIGDPILLLADLNPLIVRANVTQQEVLALAVGDQVSATIVTGAKHTGTIRYIAPVADENTNTFVIEAAFSNPNMQYKAGFSTQLDIELDEVQAVLLSPAFMALDDEGNIGVKTLSNDDTVLFTPINIVKSEQDGVWMTGLGENAKVITLGQGFVRIGDKVEAILASQGAN